MGSPDRPIQFATAAARTCGLTLPGYDEFARSRAAVHDQTEEIAEKLEAAGIAAYQPSQGDIVIIGEVTGTVESVSRKFRRLHLLPAHAQSARRRLTRELSYFLQHHSPGRVARYAVVTSGQRVPWFGNLKKARVEHLDNLKRWANEARDRFGVEVLFRGTAMTMRRVPDRPDKDGLNLHSDVIYRPTHRISPARWTKFLSWSAGRLGAHWRDCGAIRNTSDAIHYVMKLSWGREGLDDIAKNDGEIGLDELKSDELAWLHEHTFRSHPQRALGTFAVFRDGLEAVGERVEMTYSPRGEPELRRITPPKKAPRRRQRFGVPAVAGENVILGRLSARARFTEVAEPCTVVMNFRERPTTEAGRYGFGILSSRMDQAEAWAERNKGRAGRPRFKVHSNSSLDSPKPNSSPTPQQPVRGAISPPTSTPQPTSSSALAYRAEDLRVLVDFYRELRPQAPEGMHVFAALSSMDLYRGNLTLEGLRADFAMDEPTPPPEPREVMTTPKPKRVTFPVRQRMAA